MVEDGQDEDGICLGFCRLCAVTGLFRWLFGEMGGAFRGGQLRVHKVEVDTNDDEVELGKSESKKERERREREGQRGGH